MDILLVRGDIDILLVRGDIEYCQLEELKEIDILLVVGVKERLI